MCVNSANEPIKRFNTKSLYPYQSASLWLLLMRVFTVRKSHVRVNLSYVPSQLRYIYSIFSHTNPSTIFFIGDLAIQP